MERALDVLFPPVCVGCRRVGRWICRRCWATVTWAVENTCGMCGRASVTEQCSRCSEPLGVLERVLAVAEFEGTAREAVHALKYQNRHAISGLMGRLMAGAAASSGGILVVHAALHSSRRRERGYDQAALLARHAALMLGLPFDPKAMIRTRKTRDQVQLSATERRLNLENAFRCSGALQGESVLLVDDVFTTGSTLKAAALALREGGAGEITGLVFARAVAGADRR